MLQKTTYEPLDIDTADTGANGMEVELVDHEADHFEAHHQNSKHSACYERHARILIFIIAVIVVLMVVLSILFGIGIFSNEDHDTQHGDEHNTDIECIDSCCIFCDGEILDAVQHFNFFNDSKVEMKTVDVLLQ